jgi:nitrate/nitrite transporter NarK
VLSRVADRFGGRKLTLMAFYGFYVIALYWVVTPDKFFWPLLAIPFIFCPCGHTVAVTALSQYFLRSVPKSQQVMASMVISVGTGVVSGLLGMVCSSGLLKLSAIWSGSEGTLANYRLYFLMVIILLPVLSFFVHRLDKESELESL